MKRKLITIFLILAFALDVILTIRHPNTNSDTLQTPKIQTPESISKELMIHSYIKELKKLGIDATAIEDEVIASFQDYPPEIAESMNEQNIFGMILEYYDLKAQTTATDPDSEQPEMFFAFDFEYMDPETIYTDFLNSFAELTGDEIIITDITEDTNKVDYETGTGTQTVSFQCNGKNYRFDANVQQDWFDSEMLTFMGKVVSDQHTGKNLYVTSDGYQECIIFYQTQEWADRFTNAFHNIEFSRL